MEISQEEYQRPLFTIGIVADLLGVTQTTLRIWEKKGLVKPQRLGKNRYYSYCDLDLLEKIKRLLQEEKMNIAGVKEVLNRVVCWEVRECGSKKYKCPVYLAKKGEGN